MSSIWKAWNTQGRLQLQNKLRSSYNYNFFEVVFDLHKKWICFCFFIKIEVVFHLKTKELRSSSIYKKMMSSSIYKYVWGRLPFTNIFEVVFQFQKIWGRLLFWRKGEVVFHLQEKVRSSSIWSWPAVVLTKYSYFDTPTAGRVDGRVDGRPAYSDIKANSA